MRMSGGGGAGVYDRIDAAVLDGRVTVEGNMSMNTRSEPQAEQRQGGHAAHEQRAWGRGACQRLAPRHRSAFVRPADAATDADAHRSQRRNSWSVDEEGMIDGGEEPGDRAPESDAPELSPEELADVVTEVAKWRSRRRRRA